MLKIKSIHFYTNFKENDTLMKLKFPKTMHKPQIENNWSCCFFFSNRTMDSSIRLQLDVVLKSDSFFI